jgi:hypothetical protein
MFLKFGRVPSSLLHLLHIVLSHYAGFIFCAKSGKISKEISLAPVVQWIERETSNLLIEVRFLSGVPKIIQTKCPSKNCFLKVSFQAWQ